MEISAGDGFVFWTECATGDGGAVLGGVYRCPATGCTPAPSLLGAPNQCAIAMTYDSALSLL
jgi:hypothetical protein